jgi:hypothetical protein
MKEPRALFAGRPARQMPVGRHLAAGDVLPDEVVGRLPVAEAGEDLLTEIGRAGDGPVRRSPERVEEADDAAAALATGDAVRAGKCPRAASIQPSIAADDQAPGSVRDQLVVERGVVSEPQAPVVLRAPQVLVGCRPRSRTPSRRAAREEQPERQS